MSTIIRWNPVREMAAMQNAMDRLFEDAWRGARPAATAGTNPLALDVYEGDTAYTVYTALPGLAPEDITVNFHDGVLTISGEIEREAQDNARGLLLERAYGKFSRSVRLGQEVDGDKVEAEYDNGVLKLTLPKAEKALPKQIPVRVSASKN
ncbi:MAG: Hsp20/alpha crystallin family protein [Anaerolineae bacterium]|nr:Hsp20/alpha crystallin family protein [Anaerolineae bacterium]